MSHVFGRGARRGFLAAAHVALAAVPFLLFAFEGWSQAFFFLWLVEGVSLGALATSDRRASAYAGATLALLVIGGIIGAGATLGGVGLEADDDTLDRVLGSTFALSFILPAGVFLSLSSKERRRRLARAGALFLAAGLPAVVVQDAFDEDGRILSDLPFVLPLFAGAILVVGALAWGAVATWRDEGATA